MQTRVFAPIGWQRALALATVAAVVWLLAGSQRAAGDTRRDGPAAAGTVVLTVTPFATGATGATARPAREIVGGRRGDSRPNVAAVYGVPRDRPRLELRRPRRRHRQRRRRAERPQPAPVRRHRGHAHRRPQHLERHDLDARAVVEHGPVRLRWRRPVHAVRRTHGLSLRADRLRGPRDELLGHQPRRLGRGRAFLAGARSRPVGVLLARGVVDERDRVRGRPQRRRAGRPAERQRAADDLLERQARQLRDRRPLAQLRRPLGARARRTARLHAGPIRRRQRRSTGRSASAGRTTTRCRSPSIRRAGM